MTRLSPDQQLKYLAYHVEIIRFGHNRMPLEMVFVRRLAISRGNRKRHVLGAQRVGDGSGLLPIQIDIEDCGMQRLRVHQRHSLRNRTGRPHGYMTQLFEPLAKHHGNQWFVFDDQDACHGGT